MNNKQQKRNNGKIIRKVIKEVYEALKDYNEDLSKEHFYRRVLGIKVKDLGCIFYGTSQKAQQHVHLEIVNLCEKDPILQRISWIVEGLLKDINYVTAETRGRKKKEKTS